MPVLEAVDAWRVIAEPPALDAARWAGDGVEVLRIAPDEALGIKATGVEVSEDPHAIVEPEAGFSMAVLANDDELRIREHVEWDIDEHAALGQGKVAGVPVKVRLGNPTILVVQTAYADELRNRLRW